MGRALRALLAVAAIALLAAPSVGAEPGSTPDTIYVTNGAVRAIARTADTIFLGGEFTQVGPRTGSWVALSPASGQVDGAMPQVGGGKATVNGVIADGSGGFFIGGSFTHVGGTPRKNLAHILANKTVDPAWDPKASGDVNALLLVGSTVYIGGAFNGANSINGTLTRNRLAAVDATTGVATAWDPNANGAVNALTSSGSTVYIGGNFSGANSINGTLTRNRLAAVDATTGVATAWDPNVSGGVNALASSGSTVYIGGSFSGANSINGTLTRNRLAAVDLTLGLAVPWNPNANGNVLALALSGSTLFVGGNFAGANSINGTLTRNRVAAIDAMTGVATAWDPNASGGVTSVAVSGSTVYIGGNFSGANSINGTLTRNRLAAVDATTGVATAWDPNANGLVNAVAASGSAVAAGGSFSSLGGVDRRNLAALDAADGTPKAWNPSADERVDSLAVSGSTVYIGGLFNGANSINGTLTRNRVAAVDATTGVATAWDPNANGLVGAIAVSGSTVYLGGNFNGPNSINGTLTRNNVAAVDATTGVATAWDPNANGGVSSLAVSGSTVYLGGSFNGANSINGTLTRNRVAAVDATTGAATAWDPKANGLVSDIEVSGSTVYLAGVFNGANSINGTLTRNRAAAVDATTGVATAWNPNVATGNVNAIALSGSTVYIGGAFNGANSINGTLTRNRLAAVDATTGVATAWDPNGNNSVLALAVDGGGGVIAGGDFSSLGSLSQQGVAIFRQVPVNTSAPLVSGGPAVGQALTCSQGDWLGSPPQAYAFQWLLGGSPVAGATAATYTVASADAGHALSCRVTATNPSGSAVATSASLSIPAAAGPGSGVGAGNPAPPSLRKSGKPSTKLKGSKILVTTGLSGVCPAGGQTCSFQLTGSAKIPVAQASRSKKISVGKATVSVAAGKEGKLTFKLGGSAATTLEQLKKMKVTLAISMRAGSGAPASTKRTIAIKAPKPLK